MEASPSFGQEIRDSLFLLDKEAYFPNHGSFGSVPRPVFDKYIALLREVEAHPDAWFRRKADPLYFQACEVISEFIDSPSQDVVLVENVTTAVSTILKGLGLGRGDGILITSITYEDCILAVDALCKQTGATLHNLEIKLPITSKESVIEQYKQFIDGHPDIKFALVDHITSPSSVLMPVKDIAAVCHSKGIRVMVDGAHGPGQVRLSMREMGVDYYGGNLHKWTFCPRGCCFLYVRKELQHEVYPLVTSHWHFKGFQKRFSMQGTRDYTPYCVVPTAIEFLRNIGGLPAISSYNCGLLAWATELLCKRWGTDPLPIPADMKPPFISVVRLPECLGPPTRERKYEIEGHIFDKYDMQTVVALVDGQMWCRVSAQVYNTKEDYLKLAGAVEELIEKNSG